MRYFHLFLLLATTAWALVEHISRQKIPIMEPSLHKLEVGVTNSRNSSIGLRGFDIKREDPPVSDQQGRTPPMFPLPSCLWCPTAVMSKYGGMALLNEFTTEKFISVSRAVPQDLRDTCVFYTRAINKPPNSLSKVATELACRYNKYSLWVR